MIVQADRAIDLRSLSFLREVNRGLSRPQKTLPSKYLYDHRGSELFEQITELDEYYLSRTESAILRKYGSELARRVGPDRVIIEPGSGSGEKTSLLLSALERPAAYVTIEISPTALMDTSRHLREEFPGLPVVAIQGDFTRELALHDLPDSPHGRVIFFPGSTIGNLDRASAIFLLRRWAHALGDHGVIIIGVDLVKDEKVLRRAYDDAQGITASFNRNLLARINRELAADFPVDRFTHGVSFNPIEKRIELFLTSLDDCTVHIAHRSFHFHAGESIITEYCHKYTLDSFASLAREAGFKVDHAWTDHQEFFSVQLLSRRSE